MQLGREVVFKASPPEVWAVLWDVPRIVQCLPGCVAAHEIEPERRWEARMSLRVGPIRLSLPLLVEATEADAPRRLALQATGRDPLIGASVSMRVVIELEPETLGTRSHISADARVLGKLSTLGHSVIQQKADAMLDEFIGRLRQAIEG